MIAQDIASWWCSYCKEITTHRVAGLGQPWKCVKCGGNSSGKGELRVGGNDWPSASQVRKHWSHEPYQNEE